MSANGTRTSALYMGRGPVHHIFRLQLLPVKWGKPHTQQDARGLNEMILREAHRTVLDTEWEEQIPNLPVTSVRPQ